MSLAKKAEGRIIHLSFDVTLIPPPGDLGETEAALDIGRGLVKETMLMLKTMCEAEGFTVDVEAGQVVY